MDIVELAHLVVCYKGAHVSRVIDLADEMWAGGKNWYFPVGESALMAIFVGLLSSRLTRVQSVLDLPCGHGRVARHLRAAFPAAEITFCDINRPGVDFCAREFAGCGISSHEELTNTPLSLFDVIWVGSLFTHVSRDRTSRWLAYLAQHLSKNGILVATFHGVWSVEVQKTHPLIGQMQWTSILEQFSARVTDMRPIRTLRVTSSALRSHRQPIPSRSRPRLMVSGSFPTPNAVGPTTMTFSFGDLTI